MKINCILLTAALSYMSGPKYSIVMANELSAKDDSKTSNQYN